MSDSAKRLHFSERTALNMGPVPIRLVVALVFMWSGLGKILATFEPSESDLPRLADMGVISPEEAGLPPPEQLPQQTPDRAPPPEPEATSEPPVDPPSEPPAEPPAGEPGGQQPDGLARRGPAILLIQDETGPDGASDERVKLLRVYSIALILHRGAAPAPATDGPNGDGPNGADGNGGTGAQNGTQTDGTDADGVANPEREIVPEFAGEDRTPVYLAWAVAITEIAGATLVFIGLFTRVAAAGLFVVIGGAMWLTTFGPAYQSGDGFLMFIPSHAPFDIQAWTTALLQLALLGASLSLVLTGPGALSAHRFLFGNHDGHDTAHDDD